ncbi:ABC transporter ATP-binding protein [Parafrankia sp. EUN1f]|uniref:ABC transporter ATP-binding protein n=1 Tax=Parafrankia sp. EUN1f TaxID=102897 RepID=UPI0001C45ABB|nr:ABC transporter ATP-binding protein [Parafrankia sp. EUN1f]EFC81958.1 ABC transporter related protein [Parafrankia sp. EUN1f]
MLEVADLSVSYGGAVQALRKVSLQVPEHGVLTVLGSNGAGKSTLLRAVSGTLGRHGGRRDSGTITVDGAPIHKQDAASIVRTGVVQVPEGRRVFGRMTVEDNLRAGAAAARSRAAVARARERVNELFPILVSRSRQPAALLSGGEQQMLAIGRALMSDPRLLLLDEPSLGLAPMMIQRVGEIVAEIHKQGVCVVLVEQNATMALALADTAVVLDVGQVSLAGSAAALAASEQVQRLYLGHGAQAVGPEVIRPDSTDGSVGDDGRERAAGTRTLTRWQP